MLCAIMNSTSQPTDIAPRLSLLWSDRDRPRGGRHDLSVTKIVSVATALADEEDLNAVSMRKVAHRLGIGTMSLYTYVPGRAELVDVMVDAIHARIALAGHQTQHGWRRRLIECARDDFTAHLRHRWLLEVPGTRSAWGPGSVAKYDRELACLDGIGLSDAQMATVVSLVTGHVQTSARRHLAEHTDSWPPLRMADRSQVPTACRVSASPDDDGFTFGLDRILDGVATLMR